MGAPLPCSDRLRWSRWTDPRFRTVGFTARVGWQPESWPALAVLSRRPEEPGWTVTSSLLPDACFRTLAAAQDYVVGSYLKL